MIAIEGATTSMELKAGRYTCGQMERYLTPDSSHVSYLCLAMCCNFCNVERLFWTERNTKSLIQEYMKLLKLFRDPRCKQKDLWSKVSRNMRQNGVDVTANMCDRKWRNLKQAFKSNYYKTLKCPSTNRQIKDEMVRTCEKDGNWKNSEEVDEGGSREKTEKKGGRCKERHPEEGLSQYIFTDSTALLCAGLPIPPTRDVLVINQPHPVLHPLCKSLYDGVWQGLVLARSKLRIPHLLLGRRGRSPRSTLLLLCYTAVLCFLQKHNTLLLFPLGLHPIVGGYEPRPWSSTKGLKSLPAHLLAVCLCANLRRDRAIRKKIIC
uniref:Myb/SANT-like DNA-binding domain-containing protein n=1 Tax=Timema poppense TaxID=170557 RepID=A0A7R9CWB5_TIMPO|nr:unnamed protein product [Timema poppensis]